MEGDDSQIIMSDRRFNFCSNVSGFKSLNGQDYLSHTAIVGYFGQLSDSSYNELLDAAEQNLNVCHTKLKEYADKAFGTNYDPAIFECSTPEEVFTFITSKGFKYEIC